jgi:thiosulfate dehydrogenase
MYRLFGSRYFVCLLCLLVALVMGREFTGALANRSNPQYTTIADTSWHAPSLFVDNEPLGESRDLLIYGEDLIARTSHYFGPKGKIQAISNGMNCQNCHLAAGTRPWGNNYSLVYSTYPRFRARSGSIENVYKRIFDCFERSLNANGIDSNSREFLAMSTYIKWVGQNVKTNDKKSAAGIERLPFLDRAADPQKGKFVYASKCSKCHGAKGEGLLAPSGDQYTNPPLWGNNSFNTGAGLFRISNFAGFVKNNMPFGEATHATPKLSNEEAWDVAAFVNSQPRPHKDQGSDWPKLETKPIDYPFGPYADTFSEQQHKYGPFQPVAAFSRK